MTTRSLTPQRYQRGYAHRLLLVGLIIGFVTLALFRIGQSKAAADSSYIKSGLNGYCLDDYKNKSAPGNKIVLWGCNGSPAQNWALSGDNVVHQSRCLSVQSNFKSASSPIVLTDCNSEPGQVWLENGRGLFNPNSGLCLSAPGARQQLVIVNCHDQASQKWVVPSGGQNCSGSEGQKVACYAEKEWAIWQSGRVSHPELLNKYTDGAVYEAWCADFVSYVYKQAGHPFSEAYDGWNENNANKLQNYNFTLHMADSGYIPQTGDIAYFNYEGGHAEIVISGGKTPTFIYGNSATIDPTTGNGQMKANTIVNDAPEGKLVYYLSPN